MALKIQAEIKVESEPCLMAWDEKLFVGTEDGSIKSYSADLTPGPSWSAHSVQLFALCAGGGNIYSSSNDGGVKIWSAQGEKIMELPSTGADVGALQLFGKHLYAGDEDGNIIVYENYAEKARYNVLEEVKDLWLSEPYLITVRDQTVTITEVKPCESKTRFMTRHTMPGRAPLHVIGSRLLVMAMGGNSLQLHDASVDTEFKQLHVIKVSDMIVTSMAVNGDYVWTGGWDGYVRRSKISGDMLETAGEINLGTCVNALVAGSDSVYAAVSGGRIIRLKAE